MTTEQHSPENQPLTGRLFTHSRGMGFVIVNHGEENEYRVDIEDEKALNTGLPGDTVKISLHPQKVEEDTPTGEVVEVLERARKRFVGTIQRNEHSAFLIADNIKMYTDFYMPIQAAGDAQTGDKVLLEFVKWDNPNQNPEGKVVRVLGKKGEHETEMQSMALEKGFDMTFSKSIHEEAEGISREISEEEVSKRRDVRETTTFTIDPFDAKDFDDALSYRELDNGDVEIGIHIADVTHYVKRGMQIDEEADARATSVYLVDRTIPMLPEALSNDMCSLRPNEDRLAFSAIFTLSENSVKKDGGYELKDQWFGRTVIHSDRRFTYEEAEDVLNEKSDEFKSEMDSLYNLSQKLRKERFDAGAVRFESEEIKIELDEDKKPVKMTKKEHLETHGLIEEFMLLANRKVAKFVTDKVERMDGYHPFMYRIHDKPDHERMEDFINFIRPLGYILEQDENGVKSSDLNRILKESDGQPEESIIHTAAIRTMSKAVYSLNNIGHYGLAFKYYTHFTSPIRRYPDMVVHRLLQKYLDDKKISKKDQERYKRLAIHGSDREKDAAEAERDSIKYKQVEYMQPKVGEKFKGVISGLSKSGIFVQEKESLAEGLIRFRELNDDYYVLDEKNYRIVGQNNEKTYNLGDTLDIKLLDTDLEKKQIDWGLV